MCFLWKSEKLAVHSLLLLYVVLLVVCNFCFSYPLNVHTTTISGLGLLLTTHHIYLFRLFVRLSTCVQTSLHSGNVDLRKFRYLVTQEVHYNSNFEHRVPRQMKKNMMNLFEAFHK